MKQEKSRFDKFTDDTTELIDYILYRPLGYLCAKLFAKRGVSPNQVSILDIIVGLFTGILLAVSDYTGLIFAFILLHLYMILDCSDGQLARMLSKCTSRGAILDLAGNVIGGIVISIGLTINIFRNHSIGYASFLCIAGFISMLIQTSLHYYYAEEYTHFIDTGKSDKFRNPIFFNIERLGIFYKMLHSVFKLYTRFLYLLIWITNPNRYFHMNTCMKDGVAKGLILLHLQKSRSLVRSWSYLGTSSILFILSIFCLIGRLELFCWFLITIGNIYLSIMVYRQYKLDSQYVWACLDNLTCENYS